MPLKFMMVQEDAEDDFWLNLVSEDGEFWGEAQREPTTEELTVERMAEILDVDAEGPNAHDFVGAHAMLAKLLLFEVGEETTKRIFIRLGRYRGLHGLNDVCSCGDIELMKEELGA
jgi:hypothetical protein